MKKQRLVFLIYSMARGGAERVASVLLPQLCEQYEVTLVLMNERINYPVPREVEVCFLERSSPDEAGWMKLLKLPWLAWRLKKICRQQQADLVLSFMNRPNYVAVLAGIMGMNTPVIVSERGTPSKQYPTKTLNGRLNRLLIRFLYPKAKRVLTNSHGAAQDLQKNFEVPREQISTVYNPIDRKFILKRKRPDRKDADFLIVSVGRLDREKNHALTIRAFAKADLPNSELWIAGTGPEERNLNELVGRLGMEGRVHLLGEREDIPSLLESANLFVSASRQEGFPNVLLEAMASELPVVASDCLSGPREILDDRSDYECPLMELYEARFGILVPVDDEAALCEGMRHLYYNKRLRDEYAMKASMRAKDFSVEKIGSQFLNLLRDNAISNYEEKA